MYVAYFLCESGGLIRQPVEKTVCFFYLRWCAPCAASSPSSSPLFYRDRTHPSPVTSCLFRLRRDIKGTDEAAKPSKQEIRRAEAAVKRQKMLEEQQREKDKVKDRLDLIRQMKGNNVTLLDNRTGVRWGARTNPL